MKIRSIAAWGVGVMLLSMAFMGQLTGSRALASEPKKHIGRYEPQQMVEYELTRVPVDLAGLHLEPLGYGGWWVGGTEPEGYPDRYGPMTRFVALNTDTGSFMSWDPVDNPGSYCNVEEMVSWSSERETVVMSELGDGGAGYLYWSIGEEGPQIQGVCVANGSWPNQFNSDIFHARMDSNPPRIFLSQVIHWYYSSSYESDLYDIDPILHSGPGWGKIREWDENASWEALSEEVFVLNSKRELLFHTLDLGPPTWTCLEVSDFEKGLPAARDFVTTLYQHTPVLDGGARGAATTFAIEKVGDVHLTWENEALREVADSKGELEIVYPPISIKAEPAVAWVDANVSRHGSEESAKAYLKFLFSGEAQHLIAQHGYRPIDPEVLKKHSSILPPIELFPITAIAKDWEDAQQKFFSDNGVFDVIYAPKPR